MGFECFFYYHDNKAFLCIDFLTNKNFTDRCADYFCHEFLSVIRFQKKIQSDLREIEKNLTNFISFRIVNDKAEYLFSEDDNLLRALINYFQNVTFDPNEKIYVASVLREKPFLSLSVFCKPESVPHVNLFCSDGLSPVFSGNIAATMKRTGKKIHEVTEKINQSLPFFSKQVKKTYQWRNYFQDQVVSEEKAPEYFVFWKNRNIGALSEQLVCVYWDVMRLGEHFSKGSDEALLYAAFHAQSKNGLRSFGSRGDDAHAYELRAQCEKRILGIEIQEPGETPLIFLTAVCNHSGLQKTISSIRLDEVKAYAKTILQKPSVSLSETVSFH